MQHLILIAQNTGVPEVVSACFSMFLILWILAIVARLLGWM